MQNYIGNAYPVGGQAALGVLGPLGILDLSWLYQPFLTFAAAMITLALYALVAPWVRSRPLVAAAALAGTIASLVLGFALEGAIKEVCALAAIVLSVALVSGWLVARPGWRVLVPLPVAVAAALGCLGPAAGVILALVLLPLVVVLLRAVVGRRDWRELAGLAAVTLLGIVLLLPVLANFSTAYQVTSDVLSSATGTPNTLGHLPYATDPWHLFGIWLVGDWRYGPVEHHNVNFILIGIALAAAGGGLIWALRRFAVGPLLLFAVTMLGGLYLLHRGNDYADAKTLMLMTPGVVVLTILGAESLRAVGRRLEAVALVAVLLGGLVVSAALAYHDADPAPYSRYQELLKLNDRLASHEVPVLFNEWDEFGKYFLRDARPQNKPEIVDGIKPGTIQDLQRHPSIKTPTDPDEFTLDYMASKRWFIMRRSPEMSRPPVFYKRVWVGRYYELWENTGQIKVLDHLALGPDVFDPGAKPACRDVRHLAAEARSNHGRLAYVERPAQPTFLTAKAQQPGWPSYAGWPDALVPTSPGRVKAEIRFPHASTFRVWMEGAFTRETSVLVDGERVGSVSYELGYPGQYFPVGTVRLSAGNHLIEIVRGGGDLRPGNGGFVGVGARHIGPVVFSDPANEAQTVRTLDPAQAGRLCGRTLDWIEVLQ